MTVASDNPFPSILLLEHVDPATPPSGHWRLFLDTDNTLKLIDDAGTVTAVGGAATTVATDTIWDAAGDLVQGTGANTAAKLTAGTAGKVLTSNGAAAALTWETPASGGLTAIPVTFTRRVAGDYSLNSTSFANVDTGLDRTIAAATGDILLLTLSSRWGAEAVNGYIDVATIVSASPVNYVSGGTGAVGDFGLAGWQGVSGAAPLIGGPVYYTVQSGDISGGNVVLRLRYRTSTAAVKTLRAGAGQNDALFFGVMNLKH